MSAANITHNVAAVRDVNLHYAECGQGELIIFLHGFPEFWYAWRRQLEFLGESFHAVAVDMRGYNLSSKPKGVAAYRPGEVAKDIIALAHHLGAEKFSVVGHDWGGVIAWRVAELAQDRMNRLVIINAPHPVLMRRELRHNPKQRLASSYILFLRLPGSHRILSAFNFALLRPLLERGVRKGYFDRQDVDAYINAWSQPDAMRGSVAYYKAAPLRWVRRDDNQCRITVPTLVIWGERDRYLLTGVLSGLDDIVDDLTVKRVPDASHWIVHEMPDLVNTSISDFLTTPRGTALR